MANGRTNGDDHDERSVRALSTAIRAETKSDGNADDITQIREDIAAIRATQHDIYSEIRRFTEGQVTVGSSLGNIVMVQSRLSDEIAGLAGTMRDVRAVLDRYSHIFVEFGKLVERVDGLVTLRDKVEGGWKVLAWISGSSLGLLVLSGIVTVIAWFADYLPHVKG